MSTCEQMQGMTILQHGESVGRYFEDLYNHIIFGDNLKFKWDLPSGFVDYFRNAEKEIMSLPFALTYARYHDCGKPLCRTVDVNGKQHFKNHAVVSYETWMEHAGDEFVGWFILHDMDLHTLKGDCVIELAKDSRAQSLLLMAYAEIHSNASMFGGIDSTSFKIKRKHLDKAYKKITSVT